MNPFASSNPAEAIASASKYITPFCKLLLRIFLSINKAKGEKIQVRRSISLAVDAECE